jgi:hypothetical protein
MWCEYIRENRLYIYAPKEVGWVTFSPYTGDIFAKTKSDIIYFFKDYLQDWLLLNCTFDNFRSHITVFPSDDFTILGNHLSAIFSSYLALPGRFLFVYLLNETPFPFWRKPHVLFAGLDGISRKLSLLLCPPSVGLEFYTLENAGSCSPCCPQVPTTHPLFPAVLGIRIRRIRMFLGLPDPNPDPLIRSKDPDLDSAQDTSLFS